MAAKENVVLRIGANMSYKVWCVELDSRRGFHEDYRPEVEGGFTVGPFDTFDEAKSELENILFDSNYVDGVVVDTETGQKLTYFHGSYLF